MWNEPDAPNFLCAQSDSARLAAYISIFSQATPKMKLAAKEDGAIIRIGGPTLANPVGHMNTWLKYLLHDSLTTQYVDFVSYHH